jgi:thiamine-phosphate diphosphorylase
MTARSQVRERIRGLYGLADGSSDPERLGAQLLEGGCRLLQLRCKGWAHDDIHRIAEGLAARCRAHEATFIVNDHPDIAAAVDADGVHLGQGDRSTAEARRLVGPDRIIGRSTNALDQIAETLVGADYLAFGPMYPTDNLSRPKSVQGPALLRRARARVNMPLVAIGGINADRLPDIRHAGADAWAVIGAVANAEDPVAATRRLCP